MQVLVIGAGVVGLAIGRSLSLRGHEVIVAERSHGVGTGIAPTSNGWKR
jgi:L-2-hydroxyglutarate oxidase LhgO